MRYRILQYLWSLNYSSRSLLQCLRLLWDLGVTLWSNDYCILAALFLGYYVCQPSNQIVPASVIWIAVGSFSSQACELCRWLKHLSPTLRQRACKLLIIRFLYCITFFCRWDYATIDTQKYSQILVKIVRELLHRMAVTLEILMEKVSRRNHISFWTYYVPVCQHAL